MKKHESINTVEYERCPGLIVADRLENLTIKYALAFGHVAAKEWRNRIIGICIFDGRVECVELDDGFRVTDETPDHDMFWMLADFNSLLLPQVDPADLGITETTSRDQQRDQFIWSMVQFLTYRCDQRWSSTKLVKELKNLARQTTLLPPAPVCHAILKELIRSPPEGVKTYLEKGTRYWKYQPKPLVWNGRESMPMSALTRGTP